MLLTSQRRCSQCLYLLSVQVKSLAFLLYSSPHWSKGHRSLAEVPVKAKALHDIPWCRNYLFSKLWRAVKECGRAVTEAVFLSVGHAMSTVRLEYCIWDRYKSITILLIGNIKYLILLVLFFKRYDLKSKKQKQKKEGKEKKEGGKQNSCIIFLLEYTAARGACPTEWPESQSSPIKSKLSFGPNITGNKDQILNAVSKAVDLNSRYSHAILIYSETPP